MSSERFNVLNAIPLTEVMRGWGFLPKRDGELSATYTCPFPHHDDKTPSFVVDKAVREGASDLGFKCFGCGETGFGAIELAARLMGLPAGHKSQEKLNAVMDELASRCEIELSENADGKKRYDTLRTSIVGWDDFTAQETLYADMKEDEARFERGEWTEEGLRALGFRLELATRKLKKSELEDSDCAEIRVGDKMTQVDPDTGDPLYRCSLGNGFYGDPKKAETRTIAAWGEEVERLFGVQPVSRFLKRIRPEKGGAAVRIVRATKNYPIFMFSHPWGVKKYEPKDIYGNKWTWFNVKDDADLYHQWYADAALTDVLVSSDVVPEQDGRHPYIYKKDKKGNDTKRVCFERVVLCSGPRDAMAVYAHSSAHVVWLHSEQAGFDKKGGNFRPNRWLRSFINKLLNVTVEGGLYVCYDEDLTGLAASQAIALNNPQVRWLRLPKELSQITLNHRNGQKPLKDVTDFVTHFAEVEGRMPAEVQHDDPVEWFDNALFDTPSCKFWQYESARKEEDGSTRNRYKFDLRNTPVFLRARGMVRQYVVQGKESFSRYFMLGNDHIYTECFPGEKGSANKLLAQTRDLMAEWLRAHKEQNDDKGALSRAIYSAKLDQTILESIETVDFDTRSFGEDFDHFFFQNTAVMVTKDEIKPVGYGQMKWWTNSEAILEGDFRPVKQSWHVEVNGFYETERIKHEDIVACLKTTEEIKQEYARWDSWESLWKYRLVIDKPIEEMPVHFRFLWNVSRIFWEKAAAGQELSKTEEQMQDMYLVAMLHALGSALVRHRSANRQQFLHITDNGTRREDLASGGTGKTAILELLSLVRRVLRIDGKALTDGNIKLSQETEKVVPGLHNIVAIDELPPGFSPQTLYNCTLSLTSRGLYRGSVKLEGDDLPKFVVASNEQLDLSSDSTNRRIYQLLVGDWYHPKPMDGSRPAHTPADDFRKEGLKEVARNLTPTLLNEARNLLLGCVQLFFQMPEETIRPPKDSRALLRQALAASKDTEFTKWIVDYLRDNRHLGIPIAKRELAYSFLDHCGIVIGKRTLTEALKRIRENLPDFLRTSAYIMNPTRVLLTQSDIDRGFRRCAAWTHQENPDGTLKTDEHGNRLPRVLIKKAPYQDVYYFYRKGTIPKHKYDDAHIGDPDWVQPAPEEDPDAIEH